jgi:hypothetical protein
MLPTKFAWMLLGDSSNVKTQFWQALSIFLAICCVQLVVVVSIPAMEHGRRTVHIQSIKVRSVSICRVQRH